MKWEKVWKWYKKPNGEYVKFKANAVKADDKLADKSWTAVGTDPISGGYLESSSSSPSPSFKSNKGEKVDVINSRRVNG